MFKIGLVFFAGRDTLRCLALATIDDPVKKENMNLTDSTKFIHYEVDNLCLLQSYIYDYAQSNNLNCCSQYYSQYYLEQFEVLQSLLSCHSMATAFKIIINIQLLSFEVPTYVVFL